MMPGLLDTVDRQVAKITEMLLARPEDYVDRLPPDLRCARLAGSLRRGARSRAACGPMHSCPRGA